MSTIEGFHCTLTGIGKGPGLRVVKSFNCTLIAKYLSLGVAEDNGLGD